MTSNRSVWKWVGVALFGLPLLYVLSFGPACRWLSNVGSRYRIAPKMYWPIGFVASRAWHTREFRFIYEVTEWYATIGSPVSVVVETGPSGEAVYIPTCLAKKR